MAKSDNNLNAVFKDTADAIRSKTGSNDLIVPRDFADAISSIPSPEESEEIVKKLYSGTLIDAVVPDDVTSLRPYLFYYNDTLQSIDFNIVEEISQDCCSNCTNLERVYFKPYTRVIGAGAFNNCLRLTNISLPHTLTRIDSYAFQNAGKKYPQNTYTFDFVCDEDTRTYVNTYAFQYSHLSHLKLNATYVGAYAFQGCSSLLEVELFVDNGGLQNSAFANCENVEKFTFNSNSVITSLGKDVFYSLSASKPNAIVSEFDMSKSTFNTLDESVWYNCKFNGDITLPSTLIQIWGNFLGESQGNWIVKFNSIPSVSSSRYLRYDTSNFTVKYCFPYELLDQAKSEANWNSHISQMVGYDKGYAVGTTLPQYTHSSGVAINWFKDTNLTIPVTVSEGENIAYYCSLGTERVVWHIDEPTLIDGSITISDGTNTYNVGDAVPINTQLTITPSATDNTKTILYMLTVNGVDYTSAGTATITMTQDLAITVIYWNGSDIPLVPNLADNSWASLIKASKNHTLLRTWKAGDEKVALIDGQPYLARLVDKTGKFRRVSDNSIAWLTFEFTELLSTSQAYNSAGNNRPLQSPLLADMNSGTIYNSIDTDLTSLVEPVKVIVSQGGGSGVENTLVEFEGKFFLPREHDLFGWRLYSPQAEWDAIGRQDEYYQIHDDSTDKVKCLKGQTSGSDYWQMSPRAGNSYSACLVSRSGQEDYAGTSNSRGVGIRFAI